MVDCQVVNASLSCDTPLMAAGVCRACRDTRARLREFLGGGAAACSRLPDRETTPHSPSRPPRRRLSRHGAAKTGLATPCWGFERFPGRGRPLWALTRSRGRPRPSARPFAAAEFETPANGLGGANARSPPRPPSFSAAQSMRACGGTSCGTLDVVFDALARCKTTKNALSSAGPCPATPGTASSSNSTRLLTFSTCASDAGR